MAKTGCLRIQIAASKRAQILRPFSCSRSEMRVVSLGAKPVVSGQQRLGDGALSIQLARLQVSTQRTSCVGSVDIARANVSPKPRAGASLADL